MNSLSKGFTHFYNQLGICRKVQLKNLRKTYLTHLKFALGEDAKELSSHASSQVLDDFYIDDEVVAKSLRNFRIFS